MSDIRVEMKDGTVKDFPDNGAPSGGYSNSLKYRDAFAVITDPHGKITAIPAADIKQIVHESSRRGF